MCQQKGRGELPLSAYRGHRQPGFIETNVIPLWTLEPWRPGRRGQEDDIPLPLSHLTRAPRGDGSRLGGTASQCWLQRVKACPTPPNGQM